jgi:hypothetical protein
MQLQKHKLKLPHAPRIARRVSEVIYHSCTALKERLTHASRAGDAPNFTDLMLVLQKLLGVTLGAIAASVQVGNVFICLSILFLGPAFLLGLLPQ